MVGPKAIGIARAATFPSMSFEEQRAPHWLLHGELWDGAMIAIRDVINALAMLQLSKPQWCTTHALRSPPAIAYEVTQRSHKRCDLRRSIHLPTPMLPNRSQHDADASIWQWGTHTAYKKYDWITKIRTRPQNIEHNHNAFEDSARPTITLEYCTLTLLRATNRKRRWGGVPGGSRCGGGSGGARGALGGESAAEIRAWFRANGAGGSPCRPKR